MTQEVLHCIKNDTNPFNEKSSAILKIILQNKKRQRLSQKIPMAELHPMRKNQRFQKTIWLFRPSTVIKAAILKKFLLPFQMDAVQTPREALPHG